MNLCYVGTGYVGLVSAACFAELGHQVTAVDTDERRVAALSRGELPFHEVGLAHLVRVNLANGRLRFTASLAEGAGRSTVVFIAVGTPPAPDGSADLSQVEAVARGLAPVLRGRKLVAIKSTVPVGTAERVEALIAEGLPAGNRVEVASLPEFLREGRAVWDTFHPDRVVIGSEDPWATKILRELHQALGAQIVVTDRRSAELAKYAANAFLATKISFINEIAELCEGVGADVERVAEAVGLDRRIGPLFLKAGAGYGGACLPKDTRALVKMAEAAGCEASLVETGIRVNERQRKRIVEKARVMLQGFAGKTVAVLGLAFKANTDDVREAPALEIIRAIAREGGRVKAYDPVAMANARAALDCPVDFAADPYQAVAQADLALLLTEWKEFQELNLRRVKSLLRRPLFFDARNAMDQERMEALGFQYVGIGRPTANEPKPTAAPAQALQALLRECTA
ncbi:MAG TPA: UDP-glucose/GDP-mannose dehydrogenase family protein [Firmicutes bacterium]|nr:UDP-glucose/GDP-mannose dehydrogenase family protein [Bacillota bacterium]